MDAGGSVRELKCEYIPTTNEEKHFHNFHIAEMLLKKKRIKIS